MFYWIRAKKNIRMFLVNFLLFSSTFYMFTVLLIFFTNWGTQNTEMGVSEVPEIKIISVNQPSWVEVFKKFSNAKISP